ncbi:MAG: LLM class flavin-dependent oxidoreductase [Pseudomonadales bacterium]|nr:LLM class flavin-dependent oxidoreductase [Pseudomonadales bacterium]
MIELEFGLSLRRLDSVAALARQAEAQGYDYVCAGEHVFFHGPTGNGLITLAAAAGATEHIRLMSTITLLPLYPAALLAKQVAALDVISGGRFNLGVGAGGEYPKEFEACGVSVKERGSKTDEALEVMLRLWREDKVEFAGRFNQLSGVTLTPKPVQTPNPPIWVAGRSKAAMRRCAQFGDGWLPYMYTPEMLSESLVTINAQRDKYQRETSLKPGLFIFCCIHEDRERALEMANHRLSLQYNQDFSSLVDKYALAGNPDDCIARLREYADAGARTVILGAACPQNYTEENERLMAEYVLPAFKSGKSGVVI